MIACVATAAKPEEGCLNRTCEEIERVSAVREELETIGMDVDHLFKVHEVYGKCLGAHFAIEVVMIGESCTYLDVLEAKCFLFGEESESNFSTQLGLCFIQVGKRCRYVDCIEAVPLQLFVTQRVLIVRQRFSDVSGEHTIEQLCCGLKLWASPRRICIRLACKES